MELNLERDVEETEDGGGTRDDAAVAVPTTQPDESSKSGESNESSNVPGKEDMEATLDPETEAEVEKEQHESKKDAKVFPPPVTWFNANAVASRPEIFVYIGQNSLVVGKVQCREENVFADGNGTGADASWPIFVLITQHAKFTCVNVSQQEWNHLTVKDSPVISGDEMCHVRIWNIEDRSCVIYHNAHEGGKYIVAVEWSPRDPNVVYSIDCTGSLVIWRVKEKYLRKLKLETAWTLSCMAVSPHEDNIVAVGALAGSILIVDVSRDDASTLYKMHHDADLVSLTWDPTGSWKAVDLDSHHEPPLLISAVNTINEPTIRVWDRTGNDVTVLKVTESEEVQAAAAPLNIGRRTPKIFVPVGWIRDPLTNQIRLYSSVKSSIVSWTSVGSYEPVHTLHSGGQVFCIVQTGDVIWSFGRETMIVGWNLRENKQHSIIPVIKGICCVQTSSVCSQEVALGGADGILRVLTMQEGYPGRAARSVPVQTFNVDSRVTALAWHPQRDNFIGLGTGAGLLGLYEYRDDNRCVTRFEKRARGTVYSLDWGPPVYTRDFEKKMLSNDEDFTRKTASFYMYICADDSCFFINPNGWRNALVNMNHILRDSNPNIQSRGTLKMTELRWCPLKNFLCIGYFDGRIELYTPPYLQVRCVINCHKKAIQSLLWRPYDFDSHSVSLSKWLASASNEGTICLFNLADLYTREMREGVIETIRSSHKTLIGHAGVRVVSMAWSPFDPKLLVSVSYDQTAVVWDVDAGIAIARYCGHAQRLVACLFHPSNPFSVISFSDQLCSDFSMHVWDYRLHPYQEVSTRILKKVHSKRQALLIERRNKEEEPRRLEKFLAVNGGTGSVFRGDDPVPNMQNMAKSGEEVNVPKPMMPVLEADLYNFWSSQEDFFSSVAERATDENVSAEISKFPSLLWLRGRTTSKDPLIEEQLRIHTEDGDWNQAMALAEHAGMSEAVVEKALKTQNVTADLVIEVLTGSFSVRSRVLVIEAYIRKLQSSGDIRRACRYMLKIGRGSEAIKLLRQRKMFVDAVAMAKLTGEQSNLDEIYVEWTTHLKDNGNYAEAFQLHCVLGDWEQAITLLKSWNTPEAFKVGIPVALQHGKIDVATEFGIQLLEYELIQGNHEICRGLVQNYPEINIKFFLPVIRVHDAILRILRKSGEELNSEEVKAIRSEGGKDVSSAIGNYIHTFIPQKEEEALVTLAKMVTIITLENVRGESELYKKCEDLCMTWLGADSFLRSWGSSIREYFEEPTV